MKDSQLNIVVAVIGAALIGIPMAFGQTGNMSQMESVQADVRAERQADTEAQLQRELSEERRKMQEEVAIQRLTNGCLFAETQDGRSTAITEGEAFYDFARMVPYPKGTVVCDGSGNTGEINDDLVISDLARTGDRAALEQALVRAGYDPDFYLRGGFEN